MPPKVKFSREEILSAAYELVRKNGKDALSARSLASALGVSTAPIFTAFESIDALTDAVRRVPRLCMMRILPRDFLIPSPLRARDLRTSALRRMSHFSSVFCSWKAVKPTLYAIICLVIVKTSAWCETRWKAATAIRQRKPSTFTTIFRYTCTGLPCSTPTDTPFSTRVT